MIFSPKIWGSKYNVRTPGKFSGVHLTALTPGSCATENRAVPQRFSHWLNVIAAVIGRCAKNRNRFRLLADRREKLQAPLWCLRLRRRSTLHFLLRKN